MSTALVTGASGFVGAQIVKRLVANGHKVRLPARPGAAEKLARVVGQAEIVACDDVFAQTPQWWERTCEGVETLIHAAWYVNPADYLDSVRTIDCVSGSFLMAQGAVDAGVGHIIGLGTCLEYALPSDRLSVDSPTGPTTVYGAGKLALYRILDAYLAEHGVRFSWCRLFYLYGDGEHEARLYPHINSRLAAGLPVDLGDGTQLRDYLDVAQAGAAIAEVAETGQAGAINICSGRAVSIRQFAESIADRHGRRDLLNFGARPSRSGDPAVVVGVPNAMTGAHYREGGR